MKQINTTLGTPLLLLYFCVVPYTMMVPDIIGGFRLKTPSEKFLLLHIITIIIFWKIAASYHDQVHAGLRDWLDYQIFKNVENPYLSQDIALCIGSIKSEMDSGLECFAIGTGHFVITKTFLRRVCQYLST